MQNSYSTELSVSSVKTDDEFTCRNEDLITKDVNFTKTIFTTPTTFMQEITLLYLDKKI